MSGFSRAHLVDKLNSLQDTPDSITSLSRYFIFYKRYSNETVKIWLDELVNTTSANKKIAYLHLCNDILQNNAKRSMEYVRDFERVLPGALAFIYAKLPPDSRKKVHRVLSVWEERHLYPTSVIEHIRKEAGIEQKPKDSHVQRSSNASLSSNGAAPGVLGLLTNFMNQLEGVKTSVVANESEFQHLPSSVRVNSIKSIADIGSADINHIIKVVETKRKLLSSELGLRDSIAKECFNMMEHYNLRVKNLRVELHSIDRTLGILRNDFSPGSRMASMQPSGLLISEKSRSSLHAAQSSNGSSPSIESTASQAFLNLVSGSLDAANSSDSLHNSNSNSNYTPIDPNEEYSP